ncbi:unnamed protein product [Rangifer tarandus platyrhynchus]|uniref:Uncharacterized protein n=2 Tax=Rangifer tarandus platyrhynchus TaxID=3082113 RepID=A0ABN9A6S7_RANTA|nr:unnamed protein product [Rangifer tarandus platyrhynchus]
MVELMQRAPLAKHSTISAVLALGLIPWVESLKCKGFPGGASGQEPICQCRRLSETWVRSLGPGRSPRGGRGNPLQYSCLDNPHGQEEPGRLQSLGSQKSQTRLK